MKIAAILPHVEVFGGVRRYLELGNEFVRKGHDFVLFHPLGGRPDWLEFRGETRPFSEIEADTFDVALCGEYSILPFFDRIRAASKYFYFVLEGHKSEKDVVRKPYRFLGNSEGICRRMERKYGLTVIRAPGGVNPEIFHPLEHPAPPRVTFNILCYGRIYKRRKGVSYVIRAVEGLYRRHPNLKLIFFDTLVGEDRRDPRPMIQTRVPHDFHLNLPQDRMAWLYGQADLFVTAEWRAGWSNTAAEAMACRVPVVCTLSGSRDFAEDGRTALVSPFPFARLIRRRIERLILDPALRFRLAEAGSERIADFTWSRLADRLLEAFASSRSN
jgi:glycosyltransferase involved in cell wall biosynthesis